MTTETQLPDLQFTQQVDAGLPISEYPDDGRTRERWYICVESAADGRYYLPERLPSDAQQVIACVDVLFALPLRGSHSDVWESICAAVVEHATRHLGPA